MADDEDFRSQRNQHDRTILSCFSKKKKSEKKDFEKISLQQRMHRCRSFVVTTRQRGSYAIGKIVPNNDIHQDHVKPISLSLRLLLPRSLSSSSSSGISVPSSPTASWERGAKMVKNTDTTNKYLEHIRDTHDPSMHIKTIEDELKSTMGKALGKQGQKILTNLRGMEQELQEYEKLLEVLDTASETTTTTPTISHTKVMECAKRYNDFRDKALTARWELLVHRQAVGFIVNNHKHVHDHYPIGDALPVHDEEEDSIIIESTNKSKENHKKETKQFGDQLDWWQRIGRWR